MPQLEGPTTKNIQLSTRGQGALGEKGKIKSLKENCEHNIAQMNSVLTKSLEKNN